MDYRARFYSPYLNRFSQPDTLIPQLYNPQALNRYGYSLNNPIQYNDPTGHLYCDLINRQNKEDCAAGEKNIANTVIIYDRHHIVDIHDAHTSAPGRDMIKNLEGTCAAGLNTPCSDNPQNPALGNCNVGYGHFLNAGACTEDEMKKTYNADALFDQDVANKEDAVMEMFKEEEKGGTPVPLTQAQFDALVSFTYNAGSGSLAKLINESMPGNTIDPQTFSDLMHGTYSQGLPGIAPRRDAELTLFMSGFYPSFPNGLYP